MTNQDREEMLKLAERLLNYPLDHSDDELLTEVAYLLKRLARSPAPAVSVEPVADIPREVLLDKTLREYAHQQRIKACGAWSDVRNADGTINEAKAQLAAAHEGRLKAAIDELADLSVMQKENSALITAPAVSAEPDAYCVTQADGSCVSTDPRCMHNKAAVSAEPAAKVTRTARGMDVVFMQRCFYGDALYLHPDPKLAELEAENAALKSAHTALTVSENLAQEMRESFESWNLSTYEREGDHAGHALTRNADSPDEYLLLSTNNDWMVWQIAYQRGIAYANAENAALLNAIEEDLRNFTPPAEMPAKESSHD